MRPNSSAAFGCGELREGFFGERSGAAARRRGIEWSRALAAVSGPGTIDGDAVRDTRVSRNSWSIHRAVNGATVPARLVSTALECRRRNDTGWRMDPAGGVSSSLQFDVRDAAPWWKDGRVGGVVGRSLEECGLWFDFRYSGPSGTRLRKLGSPEELAARSKTWKPGEYALERTATVDPEKSGVRISVREGMFALSLRVRGEDLERSRETLLDGLSGFGAKLFDALERIAGLESGYVMPDAPYPRLRPPHVPSNGFAPGSVLDFFDLRRFEELGWKREGSAVARAALPAGAKRVTSGPLVIIRWVRDLRDASAVSAARSRQERWVLAHAELKRDGRYNEEGDLLDKPFDPEEHPPLTFYDEDNGVGYKAVVPSAIDAAQWAEFRHWLEHRKLPDGTSLNALRLIVPKRALALKLHERASREGIDAVLYADDKGRWWNPSPPGEWVES